MKNLPLEHYPPLAQKAISFLNVAKVSHKIKNRVVGSEEASYYNLSHAAELSIKALVYKITRENLPQIHDIEKLAKRFRGICGFTDEEIETLVKLKRLNNGPGGLRYVNEPIGEFLPSLFEKGVTIIEKLLEKLE